MVAAPERQAPKDRLIDSAVLMKITPCFGTAAGLVIAVVEHHLTSPVRLAADLVFGWLGFFILYRFTFALAWNSRAKLLRQSAAEQRCEVGSAPG